tara:strand:- start:13285 stop:13497 length:213 start_codon:yes stop_codon:yes gene_type:complete
MKIFFILVLLVIVFSGCFSKPTNTIQECEDKQTEQRDLCYSSSALNENDLSFCTQIITDEIRNNCINSIS